jgi:hypothetical protein
MAYEVVLKTMCDVKLKTLITTCISFYLDRSSVYFALEAKFVCWNSRFLCSRNTRAVLTCTVLRLFVCGGIRGATV